MRYPKVPVNFSTKLDKADFEDLWYSQRGRCFYTGIKMTTPRVARELTQVSIDRLDSALPYSAENCVLTCLGASLGKGNYSVDAFMSWLDSVHGDLALGNELKPNLPRHEGWAKVLIKQARGIDTQIGHEYLISQLHEQKYLCFYTGLPLVFGASSEDFRYLRSLNKASIDRKDSRLPYCPGNVVITSGAMNRLKNEAGLTKLLLFLEEFKASYLDAMVHSYG